MQYKVYSSHQIWLPRHPTDALGLRHQIEDNESEEAFRQRARVFLTTQFEGQVFIESLRELFGGDKKVEEHFGIRQDFSATMDGRQGLEKQAKFQNITAVLDELSKEVVDVIHRGQSKFVHALNHDGSSLCEDPMILSIPVKTSRKRKELLDSCTRDGGVIVWIKPVDRDAWGMFIEDYLLHARPIVIRPSNAVTTLNVKKLTKMTKGIERIVFLSKFWLTMTEPSPNAIIKQLPANSPFPYELPYGYTTEEMDFLNTRSSIERFSTYLDVFHFDKAEAWWPVHMSVCNSRLKRSFAEESIAHLANANTTYDQVQGFVAQATKNKSISFAPNQEVMMRDGEPVTHHKPKLTLRAGPPGDGAGVADVAAAAKKPRAPRRTPEEKAIQDATKKQKQEEDKAEKMRIKIAGGGRGGRAGRAAAGRGARSGRSGLQTQESEADTSTSDLDNSSSADEALNAMTKKANVAARKRKSFDIQKSKTLTAALSVAAAASEKRTRLGDSTAARAAPPPKDAPCCNISDCMQLSTWLCMHPACFDSPYCDDHRSHRVHCDVNCTYKSYIDSHYPYFHDPENGQIYGERPFGSMPT